MVTGWKNGLFRIEGFSDQEEIHPADPNEPDAAILRAQALPDDFLYEDETLVDLRRRSLREVTQRRGQTKFRASLLEAYNGRCAVTGCNLTSVLEAAHISPYRGDQTNHVQNGLLLRADIHTLFDLGKLSVSENHTVLLAPEVQDNEDYGHLAGRPLQLPVRREHLPNEDALHEHRIWSGF